MSDNQHGFRKGQSTIHSVAQLVSFIDSKLDSQIPTLVTYIDFRKAFDCLQHTVLMGKLASLNLGLGVLGWVRSYLSDRKQRVLANGVYSSFQTIKQGVPQGLILGPLFYIIYANDLTELIKNCHIALYADDTVLYTAHRDFATSVTKMQADIDSLAGWCHCNGINVNTDKTKLMTFGSTRSLTKLPLYDITYEGYPIQKVLSYKYLGMTLDNKLNYKYNSHVKKVIASVASKLKQFQRMRSFLDVKAATMVYKSMLLPLLEYGYVLLLAASAENRKRLQILQNKGLRCALSKSKDFSSDEIHNKAGLLRLKDRRDQHLLNSMYDWSKDPRKLKVKTTVGVSTRSSDKKLLKIKKPRTEKYKKCLLRLEYCGLRPIW